MAEACNLQQFNKTSSIDELFDNYIKFMRSLKEVIDTAINSLRIINDNGHKFSADRLGVDKMILNIEAIVNQLPRSIVNYLVDKNIIMLGHLRPIDAANVIYVSAQSAAITKNGKFKILQDFSPKAHRELLKYIAGKLFDDCLDI